VQTYEELSLMALSGSMAQFARLDLLESVVENNRKRLLMAQNTFKDGICCSEEKK